MTVSKKKPEHSNTPNGFTKQKSPIMTSAKTGGHAGQDVQQLTDLVLLERFHTLNGLYESKRSNAIPKEKTFHEGTKLSLKHKVNDTEKVDEESCPIPKPTPPLAQTMSKKSSNEKTKVQAKELLKFSDTLKAKLHAGAGIGVSVFRLKDSLVGENVLQSVLQDDIEYSFHQPPLPLARSEGSLYQASSRKYGGDDTKRLNPIQQQNKILHKSLAQKSATDIAKDIRHDLSKVITPKNGYLNLVNARKANTIADFNFDRKKEHEQKNTIPQLPGLSKVVFTEKKFQSFKTLEEKHNSKEDHRKNEQSGNDKEKGQDNKRRVRDAQNAGTVVKDLKRARHIRSPPSAVLVDFMQRGNSKGKFEAAVSDDEGTRDLEVTSNKVPNRPVSRKRVTDSQTSKDKSSSLIRMLKFVRSNEEMYTGSKYAESSLDKRHEMSASSYYLSTYPKIAPSLSSLKSTSRTFSPESKLSSYDRAESFYRNATPKNSFLVTPPPSTPRSCGPTPSPHNQKNVLDNHLYSISSIQKAYDSGKTKKTQEIRKQRRPLAVRQGRIRKPPDTKDPQLETCVLGRSLEQNGCDESVTDERDLEQENKAEREGKKHKTRKEKSKSGGSTKKENFTNREDDKKIPDRKAPVFNVYESFVIKSKHPIQSSTRETSEISDMKTTKVPQKMQGKLAPLTKLNSEMLKSKFILARTNKSLNDAEDISSVHLVSDPVTFSVRHPAYVSSSHIPPEQEVVQHVEKPLLGRVNGLRDFENDREETVVVFFHHDSMQHSKNQNIQMKYSSTYKNTLKQTEKGNPDLEDFEKRHTRDTAKMAKKSKKTKLTKESETGYFDHVAIKTSGEGGFKMNAANYNLLLRQHQRLENEEEMFLRLIQDDLLKKEFEFGRINPMPKIVVKNRKKIVADADPYLTESARLSAMLKKFSRTQTEESMKPKSYTMFASGYPVKREESMRHVVHKHNLETFAKKANQSSMGLQYVLPTPKRRFSFPMGHPVNPPVKTIKSLSTSSDSSSTKSLTVTDLNFELNIDDLGKRTFIPNLSRTTVPGKFQEKSLANPHNTRHKHGFTFFTLPEINRGCLIQEVDEQMEEGDFAGLDNLLYMDAHSAAILPDTGTATYRFTHDVSFDEGSRYRTSEFAHGLKGKDDPRNQHMNANGLAHQFGSAVSMRGTEPGAASQGKHEGRGREHSSSNLSNNIVFKDSVPLSLIRIEERCDLPPATTSPSSPALSSAIAASASTSSFIPPPSASRPSPLGGSAIAGGNITFRLHKEKQNWNYRLGELSVNGGGYANTTTTNASSKQDLDAMNPMNMTSVLQRNLHTRERTMATIPKSRLSSRYSSKFDTTNGAGASYSDPCMSAPSSFQQRLTDLSILESETIKYEKNRKLRRKKNQDKDS